MKGDIKGYFRTGFFSLACVLFFLYASCSREEIDENNSQNFPLVYSAFELELLDLVNKHRASLAKDSLLKVDEISVQARLHSLHMVEAKEICHHNFGSRYKALVEQVGAKYIGENVGYGYNTSKALFLAWLNSASHRKIIVGDHTHFGISAQKTTDETVYVTLIFIRK